MVRRRQWKKESCDEHARVCSGKHVSNAACFTLLTPSPTMHRDKRSPGQSQRVLPCMLCISVVSWAFPPIVARLFSNYAFAVQIACNCCIYTQCHVVIQSFCELDFTLQDIMKSHISVVKCSSSSKQDQLALLRG